MEPDLFSHEKNWMEIYFCGGNFVLNSHILIIIYCSKMPPRSFRCKSETVTKSQHSICGAKNKIVGYFRLRSLEENSAREVCILGSALRSKSARK